MSDKIIIDSDSPLTLLGGGESSARDLMEALTFAPRLVAADGGAAAALDAGLMPEAVIGDMDSLPERTRAVLPPATLHRIAEQDSTDFDKALRSVRAPMVLGVGFLGARLDHALANFAVLVRRTEARCLLIGADDVIFAAPAERWLALSLEPGARVSLFPMAPVTGQSDGLDWPIGGLDFAPAGRVGTSNRTTGGDVRLRFDATGMLVILPRAALVAAMRALVP